MAYDPFISAERAQQLQVRLMALPALFAEADYVSLHLPRTPETENLVNAELLATMKPTARIVNCARGGIVDEAALAEAVQNGVIGGAALDVYAKEPLAADSPLRGVSQRLILTPHLGASTEEAQENVAVDVAEQIRDVLLGLPARSAVNIPGLTPEVMEQLKPHLQLAETLGLLLSQLAGGDVEQLEVRLQPARKSADIINDDDMRVLALGLEEGEHGQHAGAIYQPARCALVAEHVHDVVVSGARIIPAPRFLRAKAGAARHLFRVGHAAVDDGFRDVAGQAVAA
jgi:hypothetical protein